IYGEAWTVQESFHGEIDARYAGSLKVSTVTAAGELRVSVVCAFLGAPVLIWLVRRQPRGGGPFCIVGANVEIDRKTAPRRPAALPGIKRRLS
ncbi:hypothetical protein FK513_32750, partial [Klebsiella pneumoniae]|nr:hypothetical protein [Klebsiella pneumoniae]